MNEFLQNSKRMKKKLKKIDEKVYHKKTKNLPFQLTGKRNEHPMRRWITTSK